MTGREWRDPAYLAAGSPAQQAAARALAACSVLERLAPFDPVLAGTYPLDLAVEGSDLDVLCHAPDLDRFERAVREALGRQPGFRCDRHPAGPTLAVIARFRADALPVEVFGQPLPIDRQRGYRHLLVEARLLARGGEALRRAVARERRAGLKTEPAFARALGLDGDPYERLWTLSWSEDDAIDAVLAAAGFTRSA
ncbi:MAG TPA: DUF4269 domain-containing protein [Methylomirabilota bacterium]|nr:DUF4269 domain-containing protein [Methylomirabilota bacterium]